MDESTSHLPVKGIIFDFDNTLVDTEGASMKSFEEVEHHLESNDIVDDASGVITRFQSLLTASEKDPDGVVPIDQWRTDLWSQALGDEVSNNSLVAGEVYNLWKSSRLRGIVLSSEIQSFLLGLKKKYKLLLLTNGDPQVQREKLDRCDGWQSFDSVMISGDFPYEKPEQAIFDDALERLQLKRDECIMVGDSLGTDIQGGVNSGIRTVWIHPEVVNVGKIAPRPDHHITTVLDLNKILDQMNGNALA